MNCRFTPLLFSSVFLSISAFTELARAATQHLATCDEATLRASIAQGGEILFDCDATIVLTNSLVITNDATLDANGRVVTLRGGGAVRLVNSNASLTLLGLILVDGRAQTGGGILNDGGAVTLQNCTVANHVALGTASSPGVGGFILNRTGVVSATACTFSNNLALGGKGGVIIGFAACGTPAMGGVVANESGQIHLSNCVFVVNSAIGGDGGDFSFGFGGCGAAASGGVISSTEGVVNIFSSRFEGNRANGGNSGAGGSGNGSFGGAASGGAVAASGARLNVANSLFTRNETSGGRGGRTSRGGVASGGAAACESGSAGFVACSFVENRGIAGYGRQEQGASASARGGGIFNTGTAMVDRTTFSTNAVHGSGASTRPGAGAGGNGEGGGLHNTGLIQISNTTFVDNGAAGGSGAIQEGFGNPTYVPGGDGRGGAIYNGGSLSATNVTLANNRAEAGPGATLLGQTGPNGVALGGGIYNTSTALLADTIIAYSFGPNCGGTASDGGHNISSDSSCNFSAAGSQNNSDPKLAPLADNGGPTLTMALLPGSPAINAGSETNCPATDQRGVARPAHGRCDIGAYELVLNDFRFTSMTKGTESARLRGYGPPGSSFSIQGSSQLEHWDYLADAFVQDNGLFEAVVPADDAYHFFRAAWPRGGALP
jgi:hypothetical protein